MNILAIYFCFWLLTIVTWGKKKPHVICGFWEAVHNLRLVQSIEPVVWSNARLNELLSAMFAWLLKLMPGIKMYKAGRCLLLKWAGSSLCYWWYKFLFRAQVQPVLMSLGIQSTKIAELWAALIVRWWMLLKKLRTWQTESTSLEI